MNTHFVRFATFLLLAGFCLLASDSKTYHETQIPKALSDWKKSEDGKVSICFAVNKTSFSSKEAITVRCALRNRTEKPLTILRPFSDPYYAFSAGLTILSPYGKLSYSGPWKEYMRGTGSFVELPAHTVIDETIALPGNLFPGIEKAGLYTIDYNFVSDGYPKIPAPNNFWNGQIKAGSVSISIK
jgi:hypothetical protein